MCGMKKRRKRKKRYFFLFNDILLLCRKESPKRYWLRVHITLRSPNVYVEDVQHSRFNNEFRLHCRTRTFHLYASMPDQKRAWVTYIRRSIQGTHPLEHKKMLEDTKVEVKTTKKEPEQRALKSDDKKKVVDPHDKHKKKAADPHDKLKKKPETSKTQRNKSPRKADTQKHTNELPFDPFTPKPYQNLGYNPNADLVNLYLAGNLQPLSATSLFGGNFGLNQPVFNPSLNQPNFYAGTNIANPFDVGLNQQSSSQFNQLNFTPAGNNPFTAPSNGFNNQPVAVATNPFIMPNTGNTNPFLNNNPNRYPLL